MNKINIAELLKDCPKGMELDCTMYEDVYFDYVDELNMIHCYIQHETYRTSLTFNQHGTPNSNTKSKCVIFPKGKTTWDGFVPPCKFKGQTEKMEEREIAFVDWWIENHKGESPTFADAIAWADKTMVEKACEYLRNHINEGLVIYHEQSWKCLGRFINDFKKAMKE